MAEQPHETEAEPVRLYRSLVALLARAQRDPRLRAEIARAHREFFGPEASARAGGMGEAATDPAEAIATTRFAEWYLLERDSAVLGSEPLAVLRDEVGDPPEVLDALGGSLVGLFLAENAEARELRVRDLQSGKTLDIETYGLLTLGPSDLLIGRLYRGASGRWVPSAAIAVQHDGVQLARAFVRDLQKLKLERRLSQAELEQLWFQRQPATVAEQVPPIERLEAELESLLAGMPDATRPAVADVSAELKASVRPGPVMGPLLERLAFDTSVDLERAQRVLLLIWNQHHAGDRQVDDAGPAAPTAPATTPPPGKGGFSPRPGETLGQTLARRIREGMENHEDVEELFEDVEKMLGEATDGEEEEEEDDPTLDAGNLAALVHEYLWETGREQGADRAALERFVEVQREAPSPKDEVEYLEAADLLRWLLEIYLRGAPRAGDEVGSAFRTLAAFYEWLEAEQGFALTAVIAEVRRTLIDELPRLQAASQTLSQGAPPLPANARPQLLRVTALLPEGAEVVPVDFDQPALVPLRGADLRPGDLIVAGLEARGSERGTLVGTVVVLPGGVEALLG